MAPLELPELKIEKDSTHNDIKKLMKLVKPQWQQDSIQIKKMSGGYSCTSYHCYLTDEAQEGVIIRIKRMFLEYKFPLIDSEFEHKVVEFVSEQGMFPKVFAIFQNGYCYEYVPGEILVNYSELEDDVNLPLYDEDILKLMANKLASIHLLKMEGENYSKSKFLSRLSEALRDHYPEHPDMPNKNSIQVELEELTKYVNQLPLKIVLCHGDYYPANVIWDKNSEKATIIDWEFSYIGYQEYEVAFFLQTFYLLNQALSPERSIPNETIEKLQTQFLRLYFHEWNLHCETDYTTFCNHVKFCELLVYIAFIIVEAPLLVHVAEYDPPMSSKHLLNYFYDKYMEKKNNVLQQLGLI